MTANPVETVHLHAPIGMCQNGAVDIKRADVGHFAPVLGVGMWVWVKGPRVLRSRLDSYWLEPAHFERICAVAQVILERHACGDEQNGFCPISSLVLEKQIGREFAAPALHRLQKIDYLECDRAFCPGKKALGYRFAPDIAALEAERFQISEALAERISRWKAQKSRDAVGRNPAHRVLWRNLQKLTLHPLSTGVIPPPCDADRGQLRRDAWRLSADYVNRHHWFFACDPKSGRVFNNFTSLPKALRGYALLDGQPCAEIDIRNSQPFFLAGLYRGRSAEQQRFIDLVCDGRFYEALNEASGSPFDPSNRDALKKAIFSGVLFGRCYASSRLWRGLQTLFPGMSRIIAEWKARDYRALAIELQRREASVVIGRVVPRLANAFPDMPFLTIHDSIAVPSRWATQAADLLAETVRDATGSSPKLRTILPPAEIAA